MRSIEMGKLKRMTGIILALALVMTSVSALAGLIENSSMRDEYYIIDMQTYDSRLKLRKDPSTNGKILGQYYAGCHVFVTNIIGQWAQVDTGAQTGWMMIEFLMPVAGSSGVHEPPLGTLMYPYSAGNGVALQNIYNYTTIRFLQPTGTVSVLGTIGDRWVIAGVPNENGGYDYGVIESTSVKQAEQEAVVWCKNEKETVNLREKPSYDSKVICKLYPGVRVNRLFDNYPTDNFDHVRVGSMDGYIDKKFLQINPDGSFPYCAGWAQVQQRQSTSTFFADAVWTRPSRLDIEPDEIFYVLGNYRRAVDGKECWYCAKQTWVTGLKNDEAEYSNGDEVPQLRWCFFEILQKDAQSFPGRSCRTTGVINRNVDGYGSLTLDPASNRYYPDEFANRQTIPAGTEVTIWQSENGAPNLHYAYASDEWLYVEDRSGNTLWSGYVPKNAVDYDKNIEVPYTGMNG